MLKIRNLHLLRYIYITLLDLFFRVVGSQKEKKDDHNKRLKNEHASNRLRRINSELELGSNEWEHYLEQVDKQQQSNSPPQIPNGITQIEKQQQQNGSVQVLPQNGHTHFPHTNGHHHHSVDNFHSAKVSGGSIIITSNTKSLLAPSHHKQLPLASSTSTSSFALQSSTNNKKALPSPTSVLAHMAQPLAADVFLCLKDAAEAIIGDSLTPCFMSEPPDTWNFLARSAPTSGGVPWYFVCLWFIGVWIRYAILFPFRLFVLISGSCTFALVFTTFTLVFPKCQLKATIQKFLARIYASVFVLSWSGYIRYHGQRPKRRPNQIYVANHTSLIDAFILIKDYNFSFIGQKHGGIAGALQDFLLSFQNHVWFDREEGKDRRAVQSLLKFHVQNGDNEPMLVFPEGTCVNNEYCIMFKKGSFELGATVYPIAIRYNKMFADPYWNSLQCSFGRHLLDIMTSWAIVADVYYLEPQTQQPHETSTQFAQRVKALICERAGLINVNWDGFLKRHRISTKYREQRQKSAATVIRRRLMSRPQTMGNLVSLDVTETAATESPSQDALKEKKDL